MRYTSSPADGEAARAGLAAGRTRASSTADSAHGMVTLWDGIIIGGAGGAVAGITVWLVQIGHAACLQRRDRRRNYDWLESSTAADGDPVFRSGRAIASWTNLPIDRVRYICSIDERIVLSTGEKEDMWCTRERAPR